MVVLFASSYCLCGSVLAAPVTHSQAARPHDCCHKVGKTGQPRSEQKQQCDYCSRSLSAAPSSATVVLPPTIVLLAEITPIDVTSIDREVTSADRRDHVRVVPGPTLLGLHCALNT
jgi:hypothetical protein